MERELMLLWGAILGYVVAGSTAIAAAVFRRAPERFILATLAGAWTLHTAALVLRWERIGHGPFLTMFEILASNVWSLVLAYLIAYWRIPRIRVSAAVVMPILFMMMGWMMLQAPDDSHMPQSFRTPWLYIHIGLGKVFLGAVFVALGLAGVVLLRRAGIGVQSLARLPPDARLDDLAYRCMAVGLIFDTLMLIAGAIWAQDAWGRYWNWDPLETWAFLTWLMLVGALHLRVTAKVSPVTGALMIVTVFAMAFLTFFGIPFFSKVPHQGTF